jgi:arylsulfatase A-like enzyme
VKPPDVLVVVLDTLRRDHLGCYGYPRPTSPNLDAIAADGTLFLDATAQASWTVPSMVSLLTGRYATEFRDVYAPGAVPLAESFRRAGYRTVGVVSNALLSEANGFDEGYDHYDASRTEAVPGRNVEAIMEDLWPALDAALVTDAQGHRPPLFVFVHLLDPHHPYGRYGDFDQELPLEGAYPRELQAIHEATFAQGSSWTSPDDPHAALAFDRIGRQRGAYDQGVRYMDDHLGRMFDRLGTLGLIEDGVVAIVADHGEGLWEKIALETPETLKASPPETFFFQTHGKRVDQNLVGTPFILWGRNVPRGRRVARAIENIDLYPTLLELAGIAPLPELHGESLVGLMADSSTGWNKSIHSYEPEHVAYRPAGTALKLVYPSPYAVERGSRPQVFDLAADPQERNDIAHLHQDDLAAGEAAVARWKVRYPTVSSLNRQREPEFLNDLEAMGYTGFAEDPSEAPSRDDG